MLNKYYCCLYKKIKLMPSIIKKILDISLVIK